MQQQDGTVAIAIGTETVSITIATNPAADTLNGTVTVSANAGITSLN